MKIAVPTKQNVVDGHFGHCEYFSVFTIEDNKVTNSELVPSLQGCGCKSDIVHDLSAKGVELMLAGNMGQGAFNKLVSSNIQVIRGCSGDVNTLVNEYLAGNVKDSMVMCETHNHHHGEGHHHHH